MNVTVKLCHQIKTNTIEIVDLHKRIQKQIQSMISDSVISIFKTAFNLSRSYLYIAKLLTITKIIF